MHQSASDGNMARSGARYPAEHVHSTWRRVEHLRFGVSGFGLGVEGSGLRVQRLELKVEDEGFGVQGSGCRVQGVGCRV